MKEHVCARCRGHFDAVLGLLDEAGVHYTVKPELVRGLDYYTRTTFEIVAGELGAQNAVGGGGATTTSWNCSEDPRRRRWGSAPGSSGC